MRFRVYLPLAVTALSLLTPLAAHAGGIPFFGPIIPPEITNGGVCPGSWGLLIKVINNIITFLITIAIVFVAPLMIGYAGFLMVVNPFNSGGLSQAKGILLNTVIGIVVSLSGWLIVGAVMAVLYHPDPKSGWTTNWASIITGRNTDVCLDQRGALAGDGLNQAPPGTGVSSGGGSRPTELSNVPGDACNPATVTAGAQSAQFAITDSNAKLLACVAQGESTCGTMNPPYNLNYSWNKATANGKASTAAGAYQVLLASNSACYDNGVCESAAGTPGIPLRCNTAFDAKGFSIAGATLDRCVKAAGNVPCSAAAAACLLRTQSFTAAYATDPYTSACQAKYGN